MEGFQFGEQTQETGTLLNGETGGRGEGEQRGARAQKYCSRNRTLRLFPPRGKAKASPGSGAGMVATARGAG